MDKGLRHPESIELRLPHRVIARFSRGLRADVKGCGLPQPRRSLYGVLLDLQFPIRESWYDLDRELWFRNLVRIYVRFVTPRFIPASLKTN